MDNDSDRKLEIEENLPFREGIISEIYERPDNSYVQEPQELTDLIDTSKLIQKYLPKQMDIDKILDIIKRKVLKGTHLPLTVKEIQAGYLTSPYFKDLYLFLSQNKLPSKRSTIKKVETLAESFVLLDSLLFKLVKTPDKEAAVLVIPEICVDKIIALYHTSLFAGHQGVVKTYLTMKDKFFIPNLMHYLRSFIKGCHVCQLSRSDKPPTRQLQPQIYLNYRPLSKLSMDLKVMPRSQKGHNFILCIIDEMTNYLVTVPIFRPRSEEVGQSTYRTCNIEILCPRLHNYGSRQCIHVKPDELPVQKIKHQNYDCSSIQPSILTSRTRYQDFILNFDKTFVRTRPDVA